MARLSITGNNASNFGLQEAQQDRIIFGVERWWFFGSFGLGRCRSLVATAIFSGIGPFVEITKATHATASAFKFFDAIVFVVFLFFALVVGVV